MTPESEFRKVRISPFQLLQQSVALLGDQYWLFVAINFVGLLIASLVPMGILMGPMMCGIYLCFFMRMNGQRVTFDMLFKGFDYFVESLIATLIVIGISFVALVPMIGIVVAVAIGAAASGGDEAGFLVVGPLLILGYLGMLVLSLLISICFVFVYPLIVDGQLTAIPALKLSARAALTNSLGLFLLVLVNGVISIIAACFCIIPAYLFMPIAWGTIALVYRDVFSKPSDLQA